MVLFDLPFFFTDLAAVTEVKNSYIGESLLVSLETTGLLGLAYWTFGMNRLFSNSQITSPNDFQNTTLWTNNSPLAHPAVSNLGLHPVSFPSERFFENVPSDIAFGAMETGEIGAADLSPLVVAQAPERHVFKTFLDVGYRPLVTILAVNVSFWDELPYDLQTQLIALARKIQGTVDYLAAEADKLAVSDLTDAQYTQLSLSPERERAFSETAAKYWDLSFDNINKSVLREARYFRRTKAAQMPDHDQDWAKTSISFITNRIYDASRPDLNERFLADYGDRLWYGTFEVGLDKRTAIGADHWDSYHVFQFSVEDEAQFWTALDVGLANDEKIIIMIHGFKTSMVDALLRAAILKMDLAFAGQVIAFSWPADFRVSRYLKDGVNARRSVDDFINVVNRILSLRSGSSIYVISHSMGRSSLSKRSLN